MDDNEYDAVECTIPADGRVGEPMHVRMDDGRVFTVIIPENYRPGDQMAVTIPRTPADGAVITTTTETSTFTTNQRAIGAAATGAIVGTLLVGPLVGVVVAGAAVYATTRDDQFGDAARGMGGLACQAYEKGTELATKYQVKDKLQAAGSATVSKLKEINDEYKVTDKVQEVGGKLAKQAGELDEKYGITSKASGLLVAGVSAGAREFLRASSSSSSNRK